jgi:hypothetical protein
MAKDNVARPGTPEKRRAAPSAAAGVFGFPAPTASINREALRKDRVMNSSLIAGARGVNRIQAFLDSQPAAGLREVTPAEREAIEGGILPAIAFWTVCFLAGWGAADIYYRLQ